MTRTLFCSTALLAALLLFTGCGEDDSPSPSDTSSSDTDSTDDHFNCALESDDPCLQDICQLCVDTCGSWCISMDIYPQEYSCDDGSGHAWDVWDVCPEWSYDTGF